MDERRSYSVAIALSVACHALLAASIAWAPSTSDKRDAVPDVTFEVVTQAESPPEEVASEEEAENAPTAQPPAAAAVSGPPRRATQPSTTGPAPTVFEPPSSIDIGPPPESEAQRRRRLAVALDPSAVARGTVDFGPMNTPGFDGTGHRDLPPGASGVDRAARGAEMDRFFGAQIAASGPTSRRPPPELRRAGDGGYDWSGPRVSAHVATDGTVSFNDQGPVQGRGFSASFSFDVGDAVMGARGQDVNRAEREWFLRETEEIREQLETSFRRQLAASGSRRVRAELARVWGAPGLSVARKRREILDFFGDLDEGALGDSARRVVIEFVQTYLPAGSPQAFTSRELSQFNQGRGDDQRFDPYEDAPSDENVSP